MGRDEEAASWARWTVRYGSAADEKKRDIVISVAPALTLMSGSHNSGASSKIHSGSLCVSKKKINTLERGTTEDHSRIEVAVRHCHLVTFVRHCTFKPSFFSPSSSLHPFLPRPIVWIPLVAFYVQIGKLEGKRSSVRDSLWSHNSGLVQHLLLFSSPLPPILLSHFILLSPQTSIVVQKEFTCSEFTFFDTRQGQARCVAFLWTLSLPVCKWNPLGVLVIRCEKLEICASR